MTGVYELPYVIATDEITTMAVVKDSIANTQDFFGLNSYFSLPNATFTSLGWLSHLFGRITVTHMRLVHVLIGLLTLAVLYRLLRLWQTSLYALGGTLLLATNHAFFYVSRMALQTNTAVLCEILSLAALIQAIKTRSNFYAWLAGGTAAAGWYAYNPGKVVVVLCFLYFVTLVMFFRQKYALRFLVTSGAIYTLGFMMVISPLAIATINSPTYGNEYGREQLLIFPEGRAFIKTWMHTTSEYEAMYQNMLNGLLVFNSDITDGGIEYINSGHGLVDPLTGILLWLGIGILLFKLVKKEEDVFLVTSFFFLYLFMAFFTTKNPSYTRYLLIMPFVVGLIIAAFSELEKMIGRPARIIFIFTLVMIVSLNFNTITSGYYRDKKAGHDVGDTARYVEARNTKAGYSFYLIADDQYPYYWWGIPYWWQGWFGFFAGESQTKTVLTHEALGQHAFKTPFSLLMSGKLWDIAKTNLTKTYPDLQKHDIMPDGSLVAIEVE